MRFFERMLGNLGSRSGGHQGGHHGGSKHGDYGDYRRYPQGGSQSDSPCPECGSANTNEAHFCQRCGASLSGDTCPRCGVELPAGTKFCGKCGTPQRGAGASST